MYNSELTIHKTTLYLGDIIFMSCTMVKRTIIIVLGIVVYVIINSEYQILNQTHVLHEKVLLKNISECSTSQLGIDENELSKKYKKKGCMVVTMCVMHVNNIAQRLFLF